MKIAYTTLSCPNWSWEQILNETTRLKYDGIEIRGMEGEMFLPKARPFLPENLEKTLEELHSKQIQIIGLNTSCQFHDLDKFDDFIAEGKAHIDLAQKLGVPYIRVFGNKVPDPFQKEQIIERISRGIKELCDYGSERNVRILLETHGDFSDLDHMLPVLEKVASANLGVLWDMEHTYKRYGNTIEPFIEKIFPYIEHVHVKDTKKVNGKFQLCFIGDGEVPIKNNIELLKKYGYTGYLSLEWEKKWHPELEEPEVVLPAFIQYIRAFV
ncbi:MULTISPECIES: sugar phosphate isomerase/epimerase family protein [unclassified Paenibacillus]|uniref:sugar phosphate isomerase/epimerase family protein n=1 Tax=unclassified Paenibacillus TaxID=185978 RepID=UPI0009AC9A5A|nr:MULTISPECIES: sugar phosphate isomerase/epimerase family protein [unclassified Paenibacillus]MBE1445297.1 sugar phosphate isomerase/epimerase [Paenibacillus sp. OAS669]